VWGCQFSPGGDLEAPVEQPSVTMRLARRPTTTSPCRDRLAVILGTVAQRGSPVRAGVGQLAAGKHPPLEKARTPGGRSAAIGASAGGRLTPPDGHAEPRSIAGVVGAVDRNRSGTERRAKTTAIVTLAAAQNGTSGALAESKHAGRRATWATPRTGDKRQSSRSLLS
jgi:hypothetical protein